MAYGLLPTGFAPKTLINIKTELEAAFKGAFGNSIDLSATSVFSQLIGIMAERFAELWDVGQAVYNATDPDSAEGEALVAVCALTGTIPRSATSSTVTIIATGTVGTVLLAGRQASVAVVGTKFQTLADATIAAATAWATSTVYAAGDIRKANGNIYVCTDPGTSAGSGLGPAGTGTAITDNTVEWRYVGAGAGYVQVSAESVETGEKTAAAFDLTVIETPVAGWNGVNNLSDAIKGQAVETDTELRVRREDELLGASRSTLDAVRIRVLEDLPNVISVTVFENSSDVTDGDGMPPHSVEVMVHSPGDLTGDDDDAITALVWQNVAAGISFYGNQTKTYTDVDNGNQTYTVKWSRPSLQNVYIIANIIKDPLLYPANGDDQLVDAILAVGNAYACGKNVVSSQMKAACFRVAGVLDVTSCYIGLSPSPASETTVSISLRQLAVFDTLRITVNSSDGVP